jgi:large subunit ribosomal protein L22
MRFTAKARYVRFSPYKLRPVVDVIRGKNVSYALNWLSTFPVKKAVPIKKMIESAVANAQQNNVTKQDLLIKDIRVDQGPSIRYFKAGAMGRANIYRKRLSHMSVVLESLQDKKD